ncbi:MAG: FAD-dependent oxidoreductase [Aeromicrobium sp.]|nr:FAD-dependent oxidoreductase [Aeromicrobium sp.]
MRNALIRWARQRLDRLTTMTTAVVIGSGPNGLSAGIVLAQAGIDVTVLEAQDEIGGGTRSAELTMPGLIHDVCSAAHPTGAASPFFNSLDLASHGLTWSRAEVEVANPLADGRAGIVFGDLDRTAAMLGVDGESWRRLFAPVAAHADDIATEILQPILHVPHHVRDLVPFLAQGMLPTTMLARRWQTEEARALFAGMAAHAAQPLTRPTTAALGMMFGMLAHSYGWPVAVGGSASISRALASVLEQAGGRIETRTRVTALPDADIVMFDTSPDQVLAMVGDRLPARVARPLRRWKHGPAAFKLDFAVEGGVPWLNEWARKAGTVHVGGTLEQIHAADRAASRGQMPERPFVLLCQQYLADPSRSVGDVHPVWAYAHVPHGWTGDATEAIIGQVERFAPGFRDRIVATATCTPADFQAYNANYVGGDIGGGAITPWQTAVRPRISAHPHHLGLPGLYLCSASSAPGGGVHGMAGFHAAQAALRNLP